MSFRIAIAVLIIVAAAGAQTWVPAQVRAAREIDVAAEVAGPVVRRDVKRNARVEAGEVVLRIDPTFHRLAVEKARAALDQARAREQLAQAELGRVESLVKTESAELAELDRLKATFDGAAAATLGAQVSLREAEERLVRTEIRAPEGGLLTEIQPEVGESVAVGSPVFRLLTVDDLVVEAFLTPAQMVGLTPGDRVRIELIQPRRVEAEGRVREIAQGAGRARTYRIVVELTEPPPGVLAGFDANIAIEPRSR